MEGGRRREAARRFRALSASPYRCGPRCFVWAASESQGRRASQSAAYQGLCPGFLAGLIPVEVRLGIEALTFSLCGRNISNLRVADGHWRPSLGAWRAGKRLCWLPARAFQVSSSRMELSNETTRPRGSKKLPAAQARHLCDQKTP